jgi:hypothetical protein
MLLNLRRDDFLLQALQNSFAFRDRQADGSGRDPVRALNRGNLVFNLFTVSHFSDQLHCPFHPPSLPHPTTLQALATMWEGSLMTCQGFKPYLGNPAVRHYRRAWGNVAMVELCTRPAIERARTVTLHLQRARPTSIPASPISAIALPDNRRTVMAMLQQQLDFSTD